MPSIISAAIPVYNDASALKEAVPKAVSVFESMGVQFEIIIASDASVDGTLEVAEEFAKSDSRIKVNSSPDRRGKGGAVSDSLESATGDIFCFFDVDLSTDMKHLPQLIKEIEDGTDIAAGSRLVEGSDVVRTKDRNIASAVFNKIVRLLLSSKIHDHQCGFKAFKTEKLRALMPYVNSRGWTWDTEVLALASRAGFKIVEIPVSWRCTEKTNIKVSDFFSMGMYVVRLAWRLRVKHDYSKAL